jgi:hypothetical protein
MDWDMSTISMIATFSAEQQFSLPNNTSNFEVLVSDPFVAVTMTVPADNPVAFPLVIPITRTDVSEDENEVVSVTSVSFPSASMKALSWIDPSRQTKADEGLIIKVCAAGQMLGLRSANSGSEHRISGGVGTFAHEFVMMFPNFISRVVYQSRSAIMGGAHLLHPLEAKGASIVVSVCICLILSASGKCV